MKYLTVSNIGELPYGAEEALNRLRVNVGFCGDMFKKIIVTSSVPNEGKSFISTNLWRMLAEGGTRTILVDADMRKSVLRTRHQLSYNGKEMLGLTHYLAGKAELDEVIYETNLENGYLLPTANVVMNPALLLQSDRFTGLLDSLKKQFDCVLVDTPPLSSVADGDLIASHCDGGLLVVRSGSTPRGLVSASLKQLERSGCELMGVVLNRVEMKKNPYYYKYSRYGYYSNYYYYYGDSESDKKGKKHGRNSEHGKD